ncbi:MAG: helix-turn-helix domain-containing protein [Planctomycetota bacterium]
MVGTPLRALLPGYAPFIHTGGTNGVHSRRRKAVTLRTPATFCLFGVLAGSFRVVANENVQRLHGPAAAFLSPDPERRVEAPAGSDWYYLRFDLVDQPRRRVTAATSRAWCHAATVVQPPPAEIWGLTPPLRVPATLSTSAIQVLRDCCAQWWQDDLNHLQANAALGLWLAEYVSACRNLQAEDPDDLPMRRRCQRLVHERLHQGVNIADLAAAYGYSVSYFTACFKQQTGMRPGAFIRNCRLREAARLLASEDLPLAQVAARCGYRSRTSFTRAFTQRFLASPNEWRRRRR